MGKSTRKRKVVRFVEVDRDRYAQAGEYHRHGNGFLPGPDVTNTAAGAYRREETEEEVQEETEKEEAIEKIPAAEMTLLDYFAGQALLTRPAGLVGYEEYAPEHRAELIRRLVCDCWDVAEALLAERARRAGGRKR